MDDDKDPCDWPSGDCVFSEKLRELNAENERLKQSALDDARAEVCEGIDALEHVIREQSKEIDRLKAERGQLGDCDVSDLLDERNALKDDIARLEADYAKAGQDYAAECEFRDKLQAAHARFEQEVAALRKRDYEELQALKAQLAALREAATEMVDAWNLWTSQEMYGEHIRDGMPEGDFDAWEEPVGKVWAVLQQTEAQPVRETFDAGAVRELLYAWERSDGGAGGVEDIAACVKRVRESERKP